MRDVYISLFKTLNIRMQMDLCSICHEQFDLSLGKGMVIAKHVNDKKIEDSRNRGHYFHRSCIEEWKKHCKVCFICPMDRDEIYKLYNVPNYEFIKFDIKYYESDMLRVLKECQRNKHFMQQIDDVNQVDRNNKTLAYYACYMGDYITVRGLLLRGANFHQATGAHKFTPFMAAICQNHTSIVTKLLNNKVIRQGIDTMDQYGMTGFMYACKLSHNFIITEFLIHDVLTSPQVRYCLNAYMDRFMNDPLYGKDIIHKLNHFLKPK